MLVTMPAAGAGTSMAIGSGAMGAHSQQGQCDAHHMDGKRRVQQTLGHSGKGTDIAHHVMIGDCAQLLVSLPASVPQASSAGAGFLRAAHVQEAKVEKPVGCWAPKVDGRWQIAGPTPELFE